MFTAVLARAGVSQAAFARLAGVTPRQVNKMVPRSRRRPRLGRGHRRRAAGPLARGTDHRPRRIIPGPGRSLQPEALTPGANVTCRRRARPLNRKGYILNSPRKITRRPRRTDAPNPPQIHRGRAQLPPPRRSLAQQRHRGGVSEGRRRTGRRLTCHAPRCGESHHRGAPRSRSALSPSSLDTSLPVVPHRRSFRLDARTIPIFR